jgi:hypothetical protein
VLSSEELLGLLFEVLEFTVRLPIPLFVEELFCELELVFVFVFALVFALVFVF